MDRYKEESGFIRKIMAETGAVIEPMSIDEAYLDMSAGCQGEDADASLLQCVPIARQLKERIRSERGLTATIGIASNKLLAKIASDFEKPDGLTVVSERDKVQFLRPLPARVLYGVGRVTEQVLLGAGIRTVGDLQDYGGDLRALVGSFGPKLKQFALGEDDRPLSSRRANVQRETLNFQRSTPGHQPSTIDHQPAHGDFTTLTRQFSVEDPITEARDIYRLGCFVLGRKRLVSRPLRLLGLGVSNLREPTAQQLILL